ICIKKDDELRTSDRQPRVSRRTEAAIGLSHDDRTGILGDPCRVISRSIVDDDQLNGLELLVTNAPDGVAKKTAVVETGNDDAGQDGIGHIGVEPAYLVCKANAPLGVARRRWARKQKMRFGTRSVWYLNGRSSRCGPTVGAQPYFLRARLGTWARNR